MVAHRSSSAAALFLLLHVCFAPSQALADANISITEIHVVVSNHFDAGCKIAGCSNSTAEDFMWPLGCATTFHGPGRPYA